MALPLTGTSPNWHFLQLALFLIFCAIENQTGSWGTQTPDLGMELFLKKLTEN